MTLPTTILFVLFFSFGQLFSQIKIDPEFDPNPEHIYYVRLTTGEEYRGVIEEIIEDDRLGDVVKFKTLFATMEIPATNIAELLPWEKLYRHSHRLFLTPTADPISNNGFIGNMELLALFAGIGFEDFSLMAARTFVPGMSAAEQASLVNLKYTLSSTRNKILPGGYTLALGANLAWLNHNNRMTHIFGSGTFELTRTRVTGTIFVKAAGESPSVISVGRYGSFILRYPTGAVGLCLGLDVKMPTMNDLHILAEAWNSDVAVPFNSGLILGMRLANTHVSMDFGIAVFTAPAAAPFFSVVWTPQF